MAAKNERLVLDVSGLPEVAFGHVNVSWLGNIFYLLIEGTLIALLVATYFYLETRSLRWPPGGLAPALTYGVANGVVFISSLIPARWVQRQARLGNVTGIATGLAVLAAFGAASIVLRIFEFTTLNCHWYESAYAGAIWVLIGIHTGHLVTEWIETLVLLGFALGGKMEGMRLSDVSANSVYWYFVVGWVVLIDFIIYGTTRLL